MLSTVKMMYPLVIALVVLLVLILVICAVLFSRRRSACKPCGGAVKCGLQNEEICAEMNRYNKRCVLRESYKENYAGTGNFDIVDKIETGPTRYTKIPSLKATMEYNRKLSEKDALARMKKLGIQPTFEKTAPVLSGNKIGPLKYPKIIGGMFSPRAGPWHSNIEAVDSAAMIGNNPFNQPYTMPPPLHYGWKN